MIKNKIIFLFSSSDREFIFLYDRQEFFSENSDADLSIREISKTKKNIIIIDDYRLGRKWKKVSPYCNKIIAIDDFIYKKHHVDILINSKPELSNPDSKTLKIIKKNNKKKTIFFFGKEYSITNQFFSQKFRQKKNNRLTLTFYNGGSGNILIYEKIINYITRQKKKLTINLICSPLARNTNLVIKRYKKLKNIKIINNYEIF